MQCRIEVFQAKLSVANTDCDSHTMYAVAYKCCPEANSLIWMRTRGQLLNLNALQSVLSMLCFILERSPPLPFPLLMPGITVFVTPTILHATACPCFFAHVVSLSDSVQVRVDLARKENIDWVEVYSQPVHNKRDVTWPVRTKHQCKL